jgi:glutathione S-transferase
MPDIRIHGHPISTWTRTACMTCREKGLEYELVPVRRGSDEHRALHPFARMPILEIDGLTIFESLAVTGYLDEAYPEPPLSAATVQGRVRMRTWMGICGDYVFRDVVRGIPRDRAPSEGELDTAGAVLGQIEQLVGADPFLAGDRLTLADLYLAPQIANCGEKAPALLEPLTALRAWMAPIEARPSFQATRPQAA